jgi:hypothetical protein
MKIPRRASLRLALLALALLPAASCDLVNGSEPDAEEVRRLDELNVQEAALRWAIANAETDLQPPAVLCIAVVRGGPDLLDPSDTLMARFAATSVPVRAVSYCDGPLRSREAEDRHPGVDMSHRFIFDPQTRLPGLLFILEPVNWDARGDAAEVGISFAQGGLWGTGWGCTAERGEGSNWRIRDCRKEADI